MLTRDDIRWFKDQFAAEMAPALTGTPLTVDLLTAVACQETGHIWGPLRRRGLPVADILAVCVGDTIDGPRRRAFPTSKARLLAAPRGDRMFAIARAALERMAPLVAGFEGAVANPNKFCHGFGIFQYDIQFFENEDPDYFLDERFVTFTASLGKALVELKRALVKNRLAGRTSLTDLELCSVAITYNTGSFDPELGLKQGFRSGDGRFYGENIFDFLRMSRTTAAPPTPGTSPLPPPAPIDAAGAVFEVDVRESTLRLRRTPVTSQTNVIARLPDGQRVVAVTGVPVRAFLEVETSLNGALLRGFAAREFLTPAPPVATRAGALVAAAAADIEVAVPADALPTAGIVAVSAPAPPGKITKRTENATALSLNEPGQPSRSGETPAELRASIDTIVDHLDPEKASHKRYQPRDGLTFCNIYAHDVCHLAGVYLPRVWWSGPAIERLARGEVVEPKLGATIREMRANDLFDWLKDFGLRFGWRQTGTLTKLQTEANAGAIGLLIACRVEDTKPGHVTIVLPETGGFTAKRDADGEVTAPLQSQAGASNFRRKAIANWWKDPKFADVAFWIHG